MRPMISPQQALRGWLLLMQLMLMVAGLRLPGWPGALCDLGSLACLAANVMLGRRRVA